MSRDLDVGVAIEAVPTVRDADGLALSSRNRRLSAAGRAAAGALPRALAAGAAVAGRGPEAVRAAALAVLEDAPGVMLDYLALVDPETFAEVDGRHVGPTLVLVAALVEGTRLIDNTGLRCG
jgi:pantoate--beta-alanine ligase